MDLTQYRQNPQELAKYLPGVFEASRRDHVSLSQYLESIDPTMAYAAADRGLDAFGRILKVLDLRTVAVPEIGIRASLLEDFAKDDSTQFAFGEWLERRKREIAAGPAFMRSAQRATYLSSDQPVGTTLNQIAFDMQPYYLQIAPAVPIAEVVAKTTTITGGAYQAYFLSDTAATRRNVRIAEGTHIPAVKLTGSNHTIKIRKFGRRLDTTYEQLRRVPIDLLALHIQRMMVQTEVDKLAAIIDIVVNGDQSGGNGATVYNLTTLDSSISGPTPDKLSIKAYLRFKAKFRNPYQVTTMLANEDVVVATQLLNTGTANIPLMVLQQQPGNLYGGFVPINNELADSVRLGLTDDAPSSKLVAFDSRFAVERIVELGSEITEATRWVTKQVQSLVMTYDEAYAVIDQNAIKILDLAN